MPVAARAGSARRRGAAQDDRGARQRETLDQQRQAREELSSYEPWGRPGGGAPNPAAIRFTNLRRRHLYPEDELKGHADVNHTTWQWPARFKRKAPLRPHEDSQLRFQYGEDMRRAVDNDIRYRRTRDQQRSYKELLDELVDSRKKENKKHTQKEAAIDKQLGWTDNETFKKIQAEHRRAKRSSLILPEIEKSHSIPKDIKKVEKASTVKLPDIHAKVHSDNNVTSEQKSEEKENSADEVKDNANKKKKTDKQKESKKSKKNTVVKRLSNGERIRMVVAEQDSSASLTNKTTPDSTILRMTGGVELVPLLARRRRVGARTLPSSDVTRPPDGPCEWRHMLSDEYLEELKNQMRLKCLEKEVCRRDSAEDCRRHHETWAALWGRPGHGAPQPDGRHYRNNLTHLLYLAPLVPLEHAT